MSRRPVVRMCALAFLAASLVTGPVFAKSPTKLVSYVVEAKIFTKFLFENNGGKPTEGFQGDVNGVGNYTGNVRFSAQLSPGLSAASVSLENFQLDSTATLRIELGGVNAGIQFDQLNFTGTGLLGPRLDLVRVDRTQSVAHRHGGHLEIPS